MTIYELLGFDEKSMINIDIGIDKVLKHAREKKSKREFIGEKQYINNITLKYSYKSNLAVEEYTEGLLKASELQVVEVNVDKEWAIPDIAQVLQECIPYPILFVFVFQGRYKLGSFKVCQKYLGGEILAEDLLISCWIYQESLNTELIEFNFESINTNIFEDVISINDILENFRDLCDEIYFLRWDRMYCLREVMDIFKHIEYCSGKIELEFFLRQQMTKGNYELLNDTIYLIDFPKELGIFESEKYFLNTGEFDGKRFIANKESEIGYTTFDELKNMENYVLRWERGYHFAHDIEGRLIGDED